MHVVLYDIGEKLALNNVHRCDTLNELLEQPDAATLYVGDRKSNTGFSDGGQSARMKQGVIFINPSRGLIADLGALKQHLDSGHLSSAAVDVFPVEPKKSGDPFEVSPTNEDNTILTLHIGDSALETQESVGRFISQRLEDCRFKGSTSLPVNLPQIDLGGCKGVYRITYLHDNLLDVLAHVNRALGEGSINVSFQSLAAEDELSYVITDVARTPNATTFEALRNIEDTIHVRTIS